jgi:excisionase family DNA binding protein
MQGYSAAEQAPIETHGGKSPVERKTISIMKACELVGVSRRTIYNWLSSGKIEYVRTAGGSVRIFVDTLWRDPNNANRPAAQETQAQPMWQTEGRNQA